MLFFSLCYIFIPGSNRAFIANYFSRNCLNHQQIYSKKLNDRITDYSAQAKLTGIKICSDENDLSKRVIDGQLVKVSGGRKYRKKIKKEGFKGSGFIITSMTGTSDNIKGLGKTNINASENSPHLNGNAFDNSYARFSIRKFKVTECDLWYMKEFLAEVIYNMRKEEKCWATYEKQQGCFHVVSRVQ